MNFLEFFETLYFWAFFRNRRMIFLTDRFFSFGNMMQGQNKARTTEVLRHSNMQATNNKNKTKRKQKLKCKG